MRELVCPVVAGCTLAEADQLPRPAIEKRSPNRQVELRHLFGPSEFADLIGSLALRPSARTSGSAHLQNREA
jgi:hypothetical protein